MAHGSPLKPAPKNGNQGKSGRVKSDSDVWGNSPQNTNPNVSSNSTGTSQEVLAMEERIGLNLYLNTVKAEQRGRLLTAMGNMGVGTNRVEVNQINSRKELSKDSGRRVREIVQEMEMKAKDAGKEESSRRWKRDKWTKEMLSRNYVPRAEVRKVIKKLKSESDSLRQEIQKKNSKSLAHKEKKWKTDFFV